MTEEQKTEGTRQPLGVLACLTAGFEIVARHPGLTLIPFLLDVFLWLGPRLSLAALFLAAKQFFAQLYATESVAALPGSQQTALSLAQMFDALAARFNFFSALTPAPLFGVPTLMAARRTLERPFGPRPAIEISSVFIAIPLGLILIGVGIAFATLYLRSVGRRVSTEIEPPLAGPQRSLVLWGQLLVLLLIVLMVAGTLSMTGLSFAMLFMILSVGLTYFMITLTLTLIMFAVFHLIFAIPGMVLLRRSTFHAIRESILLTRLNFMSATFLILLILVISRGFNVVWMLADPASWATLIGIAGHAFISTALTATLFIFYHDRLSFLAMAQPSGVGQEVPVHPVN